MPAQGFAQGAPGLEDLGWNDMGFEGQAQLVEQWYHDGAKGEDDDKRFCFIKKVLYDGNAAARDLNIIKLCEKDFYPPPGPDPEPIRVTVKDDSFVMILNGDVLFDFDKFDIKPARSGFSIRPPRISKRSGAMEP